MMSSGKGAPKGNSNAWKGGRLAKPDWSRYPLTGRPWVCDGCHLAPKCEQFQAGAVCAFSSELRRLKSSSRDFHRLVNELRDLAAVQKARVTHGLMYENLVLGGAPDPQVGEEIGRLTRLLETLAKLLGSRELAEARRPNKDKSSPSSTPVNTTQRR